MFTYRPNTIPQTIYVVGCGGTGSRLVPLLAQFVRTISKDLNPRGWVPSINIVLIDGDIVEEKNLLRQNFIAQDVNKNKAAVLAQRYGKAYGVNLIPYPEFITDADAKNPAGFRSKIPGIGSIPGAGAEMVLMCVDSANARRLVLGALAPLDRRIPTFFVDAGNEDDFGQVRFFTSAAICMEDGDETELIKKYKNPERVEIEHHISFLPIDLEYYRNLVDNPGLGSCADLDQTLAINAIMATYIIGIVQNYYYVKPFNYNELSISLSGSVSCTYNTVANFRNKIASYADSIEIARNSMDAKGLTRLRYMGHSEILSKFLRDNSYAISHQVNAEKVKEERAKQKAAKEKELNAPAEVLAEAIERIAEINTEVGTLRNEEQREEDLFEEVDEEA